MTTVNLTFTLPEDQNDMNFAIHGLDWALVAWDLGQELRHIMKYDDSNIYHYETVEYIRDKLYNIIDEHGVSFDMIT